MPRSLIGGWRYEPSVALTAALIMGPVHDDGFTDAQLAVGWHAERDALMQVCGRNPNPGWRPWGFWRFELRDRRPQAEAAQAARLAELGLLRDDELAGLRVRARGSERWAMVWQAVEAAHEAR